MPVSSTKDEIGLRATGILFVVATPIGNLDDITARAVNTLREVDFVACEDTRRSRILFEKLHIKTKVLSLHRFSERERSQLVIRRLLKGESGAVICDAGTPTISDPGALLVTEAYQAGIKVSPLPGPSSIMAALSISGFDCSSFVFRGFIPKKTREREDFFAGIVAYEMPCVVFETPKRIIHSLTIAQKILGDRTMILVRELTKMHEEVLRGSPGQILERLSERPTVKGEICLVIDGGLQKAVTMDVGVAVSTLMKEGFKGKTLAEEAHKRYGLKKGHAYSTFLQLVRARTADPAED
ncbi:MAG: rRNA (cytidine1402-2-O)-methyltransferase [Thermodesulfobacteriota bacterium]|nr:rRNA (cytidine1402-2-O)-methyltransferase [Thermodesulfobacteriota bacterium]